MKKVMIIINPTSGGETALDYKESLENKAKKYYDYVETKNTQKAKSFFRLGLFFDFFNYVDQQMQKSLLLFYGEFRYFIQQFIYKRITFCQRDIKESFNICI